MDAKNLAPDPALNKRTPMTERITGEKGGIKILIETALKKIAANNLGQETETAMDDIIQTLAEDKEALSSLLSFLESELKERTWSTANMPRIPNNDEIYKLGDIFAFDNLLRLIHRVIACFDKESDTENESLEQLKSAYNELIGHMAYIIMFHSEHLSNEGKEPYIPHVFANLDEQIKQDLIEKLMYGYNFRHIDDFTVSKIIKKLLPLISDDEFKINVIKKILSAEFLPQSLLESVLESMTDTIENTEVFAPLCLDILHLAKNKVLENGNSLHADDYWKIITAILDIATTFKREKSDISEQIRQLNSPSSSLKTKHGSSEGPEHNLTTYPREYRLSVIKYANKWWDKQERQKLFTELDAAFYDWTEGAGCANDMFELIRLAINSGVNLHEYSENINTLKIMEAVLQIDDVAIVERLFSEYRDVFEYLIFASLGAEGKHRDMLYSFVMKLFLSFSESYAARQAKLPHKILRIIQKHQKGQGFIDEIMNDMLQFIKDAGSESGLQTIMKKYSDKLHMQLRDQMKGLEPVQLTALFIEMLPFISAQNRFKVIKTVLADRACLTSIRQSESTSHMRVFYTRILKSCLEPELECDDNELKKIFLLLLPFPLSLEHYPGQEILKTLIKISMRLKNKKDGKIFIDKLREKYGDETVQETLQEIEEETKLFNKT